MNSGSFLYFIKAGTNSLLVFATEQNTKRVKSDSNTNIIVRLQHIGLLGMILHVLQKFFRRNYLSTF